MTRSGTLGRCKNGLLQGIPERVLDIPGIVPGIFFLRAMASTVRRISWSYLRSNNVSLQKG